VANKGGVEGDIDNTFLKSDKEEEVIHIDLPAWGETQGKLHRKERWLCESVGRGVWSTTERGWGGESGAGELRLSEEGEKKAPCGHT